MTAYETNLEKSAQEYDKSICKGWRNLLDKKRLYLYEKLKQHCNGRESRILEIGCGEGLMTRHILEDFDQVDVLDGSQFFIDFLKKQSWTQKLNYIHAMFEDYKPEKKYDGVFFTHILEHLDHPVEALEKLKEYISSSGVLLIAVPNANSIHRLVGAKMGLLETPDSLNEQDKKLGHRRIYTPQLFRSHIEKAGLHIKKMGGCMLKPISNRQIEKEWSQELIDGFFALGEDYPELCSELFAVATLK